LYATTTTNRLNLFRRGGSNAEARELRKQKRAEFLAKKKNKKAGLIEEEEVKEEAVPEPPVKADSHPIVENVTDEDEPASPINSGEEEEREGVESSATEEAEQVKEETRMTTDESPAVRSTGLLCGCL
jgi:hypothetical protein